MSDATPTIVDRFAVVDVATIGHYFNSSPDADGRVTLDVGLDVGDDLLIVGTPAELLDFGATIVSLAHSAAREVAR